MIDWLSGEPWDAFLTMTQDVNGTLQRAGPSPLLTEETRIWKRPRLAHPEQLLKRFNVCREKFNRARYGRNWRKDDRNAMSAVIGVERHANYSAHAHALLRIPGGLTADEARSWQLVFTETGGFCKLELPRSQTHVLSYVTDYVTKRGELEFTANFEPVRAQRELIPRQGER